MSTSSALPAAVTVVQSAGCHLCADARDALVEIAREFPLDVELLDAVDPRGHALIREHHAPMYPLVLVDGAFFSFGRLPRKKLRKLLAQRYPVAVV